MAKFYLLKIAPDVKRYLVWPRWIWLMTRTSLEGVEVNCELGRLLAIGVRICPYCWVVQFQRFTMLFGASCRSRSKFRIWQQGQMSRDRRWSITVFSTFSTLLEPDLYSRKGFMSPGEALTTSSNGASHDALSLFPVVLRISNSLLSCSVFASSTCVSEVLS